MDPADFQNFAVATLRTRRAVDCRFAIGRAYYSVFNVAAELLRQAQCKVDDGPPGHGQVANFLLSVISTESVADAGSWMRDARGARNKDYKMQDLKVEQFATADLIVTEAANHINALRTAFTGPPRQHILADLVLYKQKMQPGYVPPK